MGKRDRMQDILTVLRRAREPIRFQEIKRQIDEQHGNPKISTKTLSKYLHILESRGYVQYYKIKLRRGEGREYELTDYARQQMPALNDHVDILLDRIEREDINGELLELLQGRELVLQVQGLVDILLYQLVQQGGTGEMDQAARSVINAQIENIFKLAKPGITKDLAADISSIYNPKTMPQLDTAGWDDRINELEQEHTQDRIKQKGINKVLQDTRKTSKRYFPAEPTGGPEDL